MMRTAVVTGATGFIGKSFVCYLLERNYQVIAVSRCTSGLEKMQNRNLTCVDADFSSYDRLCNEIPSADIFYHFAWDGAYGEKTGDYQIQTKNTQAACEALMQAVRTGCKKFVLAGTVAELEILEHIDRNVCHPRGTCVYAAAKLMAEILCKTLAAQNHIEFNCGLFANIIGPGDRSRRSTNTILSRFLKNEAPKLVKGEGLNDWLYIKDAVRLIEAMGERGVNMKTYYIGEIPDQFLTNYSYISTQELLEDTGCKAEYDFEQSIRETAEWVRTLDL